MLQITFCSLDQKLILITTCCEEVAQNTSVTVILYLEGLILLLVLALQVLQDKQVPIYINDDNNNSLNLSLTVGTISHICNFLFFSLFSCSSLVKVCLSLFKDCIVKQFFFIALKATFKRFSVGLVSTVLFLYSYPLLCHCNNHTEKFLNGQVYLQLKKNASSEHFSISNDIYSVVKHLYTDLHVGFLQI